MKKVLSFIGWPILLFFAALLLFLSNQVSSCFSFVFGLLAELGVSKNKKAWLKDFVKIKEGLKIEEDWFSQEERLKMLREKKEVEAKLKELKVPMWRIGFAALSAYFSIDVF
jgi:hypothetical protein